MTTEPSKNARCLHVYYGGGKGKTTASIGLAVRAAGAGKRVLFLQFDKGVDKERGEHYAERKILRQIPQITLLPTGCERIRADGTFRFGVEPADLEESQRGLAEAKRAVASGDYELVILDEALGALAYGLLKEEEIVAVLDSWEAGGRRCELVLTGHKLPESVKTRADLVTHVQKVKHYFDKGVPAREGIEF
jgi:cob(I)alamin adenosyltransferase